MKNSIKMLERYKNINQQKSYLDLSKKNDFSTTKYRTIYIYNMDDIV